jgi:hypothetical protein
METDTFTHDHIRQMLLMTMEKGNNLQQTLVTTMANGTRPAVNTGDHSSEGYGVY